ncbi:hypothetical protein PMG71_18010, partial [Roseofilum sp. BLCC_M154]
YLRHFPVGWVERSETQRICWVFGCRRHARSSTQPTNQGIFGFGEGIVWVIEVACQMGKISEAG